MRFAVLPQVVAGFASYTLLRFEINVREASVMGFVGAGGIGAGTLVAIRKFYYSDVSAILLMIIVTVFVIDIGTGWIRGRLFGKERRGHEPDCRCRTPNGLRARYPTSSTGRLPRGWRRPDAARRLGDLRLRPGRSRLLADADAERACTSSAGSR